MLWWKKEPKPDQKLIEKAFTFAQPAVHLVATEEAVRSYLAGLPELPAGIAWPTRGGNPLFLLASIDLAELQACVPMDWLPKDGRLLFFIDDELEDDDPESWSVMHVPSAQPGTASSAAEIAFAHAAEKVPVKLTRILSVPSWEREEIKCLKMDDVTSEELIELSEKAYGDLPRHKLGGFPDPIQGDEMEALCEGRRRRSDGLLVTHEEEMREEFIEMAQREWRLLAQFDSDDAADFTWGDAGILYFFVREEDSRRGDFSNVGFCWQCH
jgi:uncharacterized protein YwqG